jgi:hypothetical protein
MEPLDLFDAKTGTHHINAKSYARASGDAVVHLDERSTCVSIFDGRSVGYVSHHDFTNAQGHATIYASGDASVSLRGNARCFATGGAKVRAYSAGNLVNVKDGAMARVSGGAVVVAEDDAYVMVVNDAWVELRDRAVAMSLSPATEIVGAVRVGEPVYGVQRWQVPGAPAFGGIHPNMWPY